MFIKGENGLYPKMINQSKAGAVSVAQSFIIELFEDSFCGFLDVFSNPKNVNLAFIYLFHKFDGCGMAASGFKQGICFIQNIIRSKDNSFFFLNLFVNGFCSQIMLIFRNGEGTEGPCINKYFQSDAPPYRYLS